jgi:hypothetical protein
MGLRRTFAAASLTSLVAAGAVITAPAGAQTPVPYRASAGGTALELSLFGQGLTIGRSEAAADGTPAQTAHAAGALLPGLAFGEETADAANGGDDQPTCSPLTLPAEVPVLDLAVACGTAAVANGTSAANAGVAEITVSATELLQDTPLSQLPIQGTVDQLLGGLAPIFDVVDQLGLDAESAVRDLLAGITDGGDLLSIQLGPSSATTTVQDGAVTASSAAQGAVIQVVDRSLLNLPPVLTIEVGASGASVTADRTTGTATPEIDPALVRVTVAADIATLLGLPTAPIEVALGQDLCLPLPPPLESCITAAGGSTADTDDGGKRATSAAVGLRLLTGLPGGGIVLTLAGSTAEAAAAAPQAPAPQETPRQEGALPRTGVEDNLPLALALAVLGVAGLSAVAATRRRPA